MSNEKNLPVHKNKNEVSLHDGGLRAGSLIGQALANLNKDQTQNLMAKAAEEALRLEVKGLEQNMDYRAGKRAAEDHIETFNMLEKRGGMTRQTVVSDIKTGAGNMRIESKSGATCFVASVAYGDPNHSDVMLLRKFRDEVLVNSSVGRIFIDWYWRTGPHLARVIGHSQRMKACSRWLIGCLVYLLRKYF